jgi:hypothetical protein
MSKSRILYNYSYRELQQIPDNSGKCYYESYWKIDVVFKKFSGPLQGFEVMLTPQPGAKIVKFACGYKVLGKFRESALGISRRNYKKGERINVDCFLAECHGTQKSFLAIASNDPNVVLIRWAPLRIKQTNRTVINYAKSAWKFIRGTLIKYSIKAILNS